MDDSLALEIQMFLIPVVTLIGAIKAFHGLLSLVESLEPTRFQD